MNIGDPRIRRCPNHHLKDQTLALNMFFNHQRDYENNSIASWESIRSSHLCPIDHLVVPFDGRDHTREINLRIIFFVSTFFQSQFIRFPPLNVTLQLKTTFWPGFTVMLDITASSILGGPHVLTEIESIWVTNERLRNRHNLFCGNMFDMICGTFYEQTLFPQLAKFLVTFILCYGMAHEAIQKKCFICKDPLNT